MTPDEVAALDRSQWRYEVDGEPLNVARAFAAWLVNPAEPSRGRALVAAAAWPDVHRLVVEGASLPLGLALTHMSTTVRYPADGMAYVISPLLHPDQTEAVVMGAEGPTVVQAATVTLLREAGEWRVLAVGEPVPPAAIALTAYSW